MKHIFQYWYTTLWYDIDWYVHVLTNRSDATNRKLLMAMTSAAVLYDRITDSGVFVKRSHVGVREVGAGAGYCMVCLKSKRMKLS